VQTRIEPFAGAAGYSVYWEPKEVTLIERNPMVFGVWKYLQRVSRTEVMRLPSNISHVDELSPRVCQEAKWLIGFWFNNGLTKPATQRSNWARKPIRAGSFWSESIKQRIARQVDRIRHWDIVEGSWEDAPDIKAHWHVDPPYDNTAGEAYRWNRDSIDYGDLGKWCVSRLGFVQVCENDGATWLPFRLFSILKTYQGRGYSVEAIYETANWSRERRPNGKGRGRRSSISCCARAKRVATRLGGRSHRVRRTAG
jgi:hypothetical protein